ncbi:MAG: hypothetical protein ABI614_27945, partial [Planctomycetota bacterium]
ARLWDAKTGAPRGEPMKQEGSVSAVAFSPNGDTVLTGSQDNTARLWDAKTGAPRGAPRGAPMKHEDSLYAVAFSPDGRCIVTVTRDALTWHVEHSLGVWLPRSTVWANGVRWSSPPVLTEPTGESIRIAEAWTGDSLLIRDIARDEPEQGLPDLAGTAGELLVEYQKRFALKFEDDQRSPNLKPLYPIPTFGSGNGGGNTAP